MSGYRNKVDTSKCHFCPRKDSIEVHHIVPQRFNGSDKRENLVAVCERCHGKLEALYDSRFYNALGLDDERGGRKAHFECVARDCSNRADFRVRNIGYGSYHYRCIEHAAETLEDSRISREEADNYAEPVSSKSVDALISKIKKLRFSGLSCVRGDSE